MGGIANSANLPIFAIQIGKIRPPYLARPAFGDPQTQKGGGGDGSWGGGDEIKITVSGPKREPISLHSV